MDRPKERITPFLRRLEILWSSHPDLRFTQMVSMITKGQDGFYWDDDQTLEHIEKLIEQSPQDKDK